MKKIILFVLAFIISTAYAFDGKEHPIKFVVPFAPGGGTDNAIRVYQKYINLLGYNSVIEYKPGADGLLGKKDFLARNDLSGYTLLVTGSMPMAHEDSFVKDKGWTANDFTMVSDIISIPSVVVSSKKSGIVSFDVLRHKVKTRESLFFAYGALPGKFSSMILLDDMDYDPKKVTFVPYKGAAPALADVIAGHTDLVIIPVNMALPLYDSDKINVLYTDSLKRLEKIPTVPTAQELKLSLKNPGSWGVVLPKDIDRNIQNFYTELFKKIASDPRLLEDLHVMNATVDASRIGPKFMADSYKTNMNLFGRFSNLD